MDCDDRASVQAGVKEVSRKSDLEAQEARRVLRDDAHAGRQDRRFRVPYAALPTDIAGSPPDRCDVDAVTSRGTPGGETRRGRDETGTGGREAGTTNSLPEAKDAESTSRYRLAPTRDLETSDCSRPRIASRQPQRGDSRLNEGESHLRIAREPKNADFRPVGWHTIGTASYG
jgi:hypothetical protein